MPTACYRPTSMASSRTLKTTKSPTSPSNPWTPVLPEAPLQSRPSLQPPIPALPRPKEFRRSRLEHLQFLPHSLLGHGWQLQQQLPSNLGIPDSTSTPNKRNKTNHAFNSDGDEPSPKKPKKQQQVHAKEGKGNQVHNSDQAPLLKLKGDESYSELVMKPQQLKHLPKQPNSSNSICANFHILGHWHASCQRKYSHKKLPTDLQRAAEIWIKKCREDLKEKQASN
jgi:hypothetical protein